MRSIVKRMLEPGISYRRYVLSAYPLAMLPSMLLGALAYGVVDALGVNSEYIAAPGREVNAGEVLGVVVFAPVVETLLLAVLLWFLSLLSRNLVFVAAISALLWAGLHASFGALWFFGTVWSFFVYSCAYLAWRNTSLVRAYFAAALPHLLINLTAMLAVWGIENAA